MENAWKGTMYKGLRVAAVVPAYNESLLIGKTIATMPDFVDHVIVIDDLSTDDTARRAEAVGDLAQLDLPHLERHRLAGHLFDRGVHRDLRPRRGEVDTQLARDDR